MKFMVMVNQKYLVSVEANTNGGAEHKILDNVYYGIEGCQAFSPEEMKTEFFRSCFEHCETISYSELFNKAAEYKRLQDEKNACLGHIADLLKEQEELKEKLEAVKNNIRICECNVKELSHQIPTVL